MKTKDHDKFIEDLSKVSTTIDVLTRYSRANRHVTCLCKVDGHVWEAKPTNLLHGKGCPKCSKVYRRTHEEFLEDVRKINPHIEVVGGVFENMTKPLVVKCCLCQSVFTTKCSYLLSKKTRCPNCASNRHKTHEEFVNIIEKVSPTITVVGKYVRSVDKVACKCKVCDHEWEAHAGGLMQGSGCRKCAGTLPKTHQQFVLEMSLKHPNIEVIGNYTGGKFSVQCKCKIDGHIWNPTPNNLLKPQKQGCPKCAKTGYSVDKLGYFYLYRIGHDFGYGISNAIKARIRDHKRTFRKADVSAELILLLEGDGVSILELEKGIKKNFRHCGIQLEGFKTESVCSEDYEKFISLLNNTIEISQGRIKEIDKCS